MEGLVAKRSKISFDPKAFLSKVNGGRAVSDYRKDQIVYRQGEPSDSVFYIQSGKVKQTVLSGAIQSDAAYAVDSRIEGGLAYGGGEAERPGVFGNS